MNINDIETDKLLDVQLCTKKNDTHNATWVSAKTVFDFDMYVVGGNCFGGLYKCSKDTEGDRIKNLVLKMDLNGFKT